MIRSLIIEACFCFAGYVVGELINYLSRKYRILRWLGIEATPKKSRLKWIMYRIRWWKWFLVDGPNLMRIFLAAKDAGADAHSRRLLYDRADAEHLKKEPLPPE